jgi:hypothetical protein
MQLSHRARVFRLLAATALAASLASSCSLPDARPLPPGCFAFGVFGDGPYRSWEVGRFRRLLRDVDHADIAWLIHVGDTFWYPCTDDNYRRAFDAMNAIDHAVVYTPGDNEWADCHDKLAGGYEPLERLGFLRSMYFKTPDRSLGGQPMRLESQGEDSTYAEFVENARWIRGGFVFATVHMVGAENAQEPYLGRGPAATAEVARRIDAALAWMEEAFALAETNGLTGVVIAMHGSPGLQYHPRPRTGYESFLDRLEERVKEFGGPVLLIHGDGHQFRVDHSLRDRATGEPIANFTRLETFGSPDIGWVRVVVDSTAGEIVVYEPRKMKWWWL